MTTFHSLAAVIELCASAMAEDKEQEQVWRRKAYVWRKLGKVLPGGAPHTRGSGASRRYAVSAIPLIGVLLLTSNRFGSVELLDEISRAIQRNLTKNRAFSQCWSAALAREEERHYKMLTAEEETDDGKIDEAETHEVSTSEYTFLTIAFPGPARLELVVRCGTAPQIVPGEEVDIYSFDLGYVFSGLFDEGARLFGEGFRLTSAPRVRRRS
jgi:hypothetical protein